MSDIYAEFYGLERSPFNITPDPRFLLYTQKHREAFNHLLFGITQRKGFIQITGEVGCGKTTICRAMLSQLDEEYISALILNPVMTGVQFLRSMLKEFGIESPANDRLTCLETLNKFLLEKAKERKVVVLIIDEAQDLSMEMLEEIRLISNLETDDEKLLQIVLVGQPELRDMLNDPRMRQLRQRITVRYHLEPLKKTELDEYIAHRIRTSGGNGRPTFSPGSRRRIFKYSKGIPRVVNAICDKTLLCGFVDGTEEMQAKHVKRAIRDLEGQFS